MNSPTRLAAVRSELAFLVLAAIVLSSLAFSAAQAPHLADPRLVMWVATIDVMVGLPIAAYYLLHRRGRWPWIVAIVVMSLSFQVARLLTSGLDERGLVTVGLTVAPAVVLSVAGFGLTKVVGIVRLALDDTQQYWNDRILSGVRARAGDHPATLLMATEVGLLVFATLGWRLASPTSEDQIDFFGNTRASSYRAVLAGLGVAALIEVGVVHLLVLELWSAAAANVVTALGLYTLVWLVGDYQAVRLHPHSVDGDFVRLRVGFRCRVDIPIDIIESVGAERGPERPRTEEEAVAVPLGEPNIVVRLRQPVQVIGLFGRTRSATTVWLSADEPRSMVMSIEQRLRGTTT